MSPVKDEEASLDVVDSWIKSSSGCSLQDFEGDQRLGSENDVLSHDEETADVEDIKPEEVKCDRFN